MKDYDSALKDYKKCVELDPKMISAYNNIGVITYPFNFNIYNNNNNHINLKL